MSVSEHLPTLHDPAALWLMAGVFGFLSLASAVGFVLGRRTGGASEAARRTIANLNARLRAWWVIIGLCALAILLGRPGTAVLFGMASLFALRELAALSPEGPGDRPFPFAVSLLIILLQYGSVALRWNGLFLTLIPVYVLLFIPTWLAVRGECNSFLARVAQAQWGLMIGVYCVSHAPALLALPLPLWAGARLLLFFLLVVQLSDVFQYIWGKALGRRKIAPRVSPNKTWEGFLGGAGTATALGTALWWLTPFCPWQAAVMSLIITLCGFAGGLVMSAIKRDRGLKDFGTLIEGHGGVLDRIDSICFAAPVFYHLTRVCFL